MNAAQEQLRIRNYCHNNILGVLTIYIHISIDVMIDFVVTIFVVVTVITTTTIIIIIVIIIIIIIIIIIVTTTTTTNILSLL